jgi:hypothetical protein
MKANYRSLTLRKALIALAFVVAIAGGLFARSGPVATYQCQFASGPIVVDGRDNDDAWKHAQPVNDFKMPWVRNGSTKPPTATRAKLLWDDQYLYFHAQMDDADLFADVTKHDGQTWDNDVFELFLKPGEDQPAYYEFQVNAANTTFDMYVPQRSALSNPGLKSDGEFDFKTAVRLDGTLNARTDKDTGWSVEGRIAWKDFGRSGGGPHANDVWTFALCRYDFSVDSKSPALSTSAPLGTNNFPTFHYYEDYAPIRFVGKNERVPR